MTAEKKTRKAKKRPEEEETKDQAQAGPDTEGAEQAVEEAEVAKAEAPAEVEGQPTEEQPEGPVEEVEAKAVPKEADLKKPLDKMTAKELREVALGIPGITGVHAMKKDDLLAAITEAWGLVAEKPPKKVKEAKATVSVADLKAKIQEFKAKRIEAIQKKDKRMAGVYRRKISRLKKRTRRAA